MTVEIITAAMLCSAIWSVLCRIHKMQPGVTKPTVVIQHAALGMALFSAFLLPPPYSKAALVAGVMVFLLLSSARWRKGAPGGTESTEPKARKRYSWDAES
jgi:hypothetical protein